MTASEAIARAKETRQGAIDYSQYLKWINVIEGRVQTEILGKPLSEIIIYSEENDNISLLIPHPYDEVYIYYLCAMVDFFNEELDLYNVDAQIFDDKFEAFKKHYAKNNEGATVQIHGWWKS